MLFKEKNNYVFDSNGKTMKMIKYKGMLGAGSGRHD